MSPPRLTSEQCIAAVEALKQHNNNQSRAAIALGLGRAAFQHRLHRAAILGLAGTEPVLPGFAIKSVSTQKDDAGNTQKEWIQQRQLGEEFKLPDGHVIKGLSALTDSDGRI